MALNPQQQAFKDFYINPGSETFGLVKESALKAGYGEGYADGLMAPSTGNKWIQEITSDQETNDLAELALKESLKMDEYDKDRVPALTAIKQKSAMFVLERLKKDKWSERKELTGKDGKDFLPTPIIDILSK